MKKRFLLFITLSFFNAKSQTLEEKIAAKACTCLEKGKEVNEEIYRNCLTNSMAEVVLKDKDAKSREGISTVEGIKSLLQKSDETISKTCSKFLPKAPENKADIYYNDSKNKEAQNSYTVAKDFMLAKNYKLAIEGLQIALKQDPNFVLALDDIAVCYRQLEDYDNAIKYYKKSLDIYPEGEYALMNIGVVYSLKSDYKTAIDYYERLIKYQPNNAEGYFGAGKNYLQINNDEKALNDIFIAHRIYSADKSEYTKDTEMIMGAIYQKMVKENKESIFKKIAAENNIVIE
ncbi:lipopolysaccharide assembly protein LapB [Flavobacterium sp. SLB02]|uniref:tetratricopeptide repeat protein n=1 Tax=Flavobacterium sp. SLB02 TaxID=2665645 RepID=UPI0012AA579D|nr:tetratricopeptide repeat protein [Flavobacterium sp. SLB02]QGK76346.1 tetratricopeptide repeat protein [Flavobacterium sp. SLB02]